MSDLGSEETVPLVESQEKVVKCKQNRIYGLSLFLFISLMLITDLILTSINVSATYDILSANNQPGDLIPVEKLPTAFRVRNLPSVKDQYSRGSCWDFATIRFLEERYRKQFNMENSYLKFSEQAHGKSMINYCRENPEKCPDTPTSQGSATDGYPSWIYHFNSVLGTKLVPELVNCPYMPKEGTDEACGGYDEFLKTSPISYNVTSYKPLYQIDEIKQAIATKNKTFPLVTELFYQQNFIPCDSSLGYKNFCKNSQNCPERLQNANFDRQCISLDLMTTSEAAFLSKSPYTLGAHAMLLVGYNDEFITPGSTPGGFIVLNSWGPQLSHSAEYFSGEISRRDDEFLCPGAQNPRNWVPVDFEGEDKWKLRNITILRFVRDGYKPGHFHSDFADYLEVLGSILDESKFYAISKISDSIQDSHRVELAVAESAQDVLDKKFTSFVTLPAAPVDMLAFAFEPLGISDKTADSPDQCGYYFIPYDFVRKVQEMNGLWFVEDMEVQFTEESGNMNQEMKDAVQEQVVVEFVSHTPWLDDERQVPRF